MVPITINDTNPAGMSYFVDGKPGSSSGNLVRIEGDTLAEGPHLLTVESKDAVGNSASKSWHFTIDRTPPAVELFVRNGHDNSTVAAVVGKPVVVSKQATLAWKVTDANGVAGKVIVRLPNAKPASYDPDSSTVFNSTAVADGHYNFTISSRDVPGNRATSTWDLVVDNTPPKVSVGVSGGDVHGTTKVKLAVQDENLKSAMLYVGDRLRANVTGLGEYDLDTTGLPDGKYEIKLAALDMAGNEGTASAMMTVANVKPEIETVALLGAAGGLGGGAAVAWVIASRRRR
jgi:hypothetical protein